MLNSLRSRAGYVVAGTLLVLFMQSLAGQQRAHPVDPADGRIPALTRAR